MFKWLKLFGIASGLVPVLVQLIKTFEESDVPGAEKKKAVMAALRQIWESVQSLVGSKTAVARLPFEMLEPVLSIMVDALVGGFNAIGTFDKSKPSAEGLQPNSASAAALGAGLATT